jgi:thioester reductase-like protein
VRDVEGFWQLLTAGKTAITEVPEDRWNVDRYYSPEADAAGRMITRWGGFVDQLKEFDASFWGISPREASRMDPQQRWLLETAWEALEDAGIPPSRLRGSSTGVFVGISSNDYGSLQLSDYPQIDVHTNSGGTMSIAANRISFQLDFKGPSVAIDTACSSALVAVSQACRAIWTGECEAALAGGVNALITPHTSVGFSKANMLSPSGRCFAFDARADGYVRGEGAGLIFLQPLEQAIEAGDRIYALIRSAVVNQDGYSSTMTVPTVESQTGMLREAYEKAGVAPGRVAYVEAHGTGTPVGDPIEATALGRVIGEGRKDRGPCPIGSVKTNIGHLESASGIAGLIKAALILQHGTIPPSLNFETPNPQIPFDELNLEIVQRNQPLVHGDGDPPVVAVNSFGFGGTNSHVVLEGCSSPEIKRRSSGRPEDRPFVLPVSARDAVSLRESAKTIRDCLKDRSQDLADFCGTAGRRKEHHGERLVVLGSDRAQLQERFDRWIEDGESCEGVISGTHASGPDSIVFVYTGQGPQRWAMGCQLLTREPVFRQTIEQIDSLLKPLAGWSLLAELTCPETESRMNRTDVAQPGIFALQVALTELWKSWGITPAATVGHSVGEVAAAYCAGIYSLKDAVRIVFERSRLQETTGGRGRMLAAGISPQEARKLIRPHEGEIELAAINSPGLVTLAGETGVVEEISGQLESEGRFVRLLPIDYAFHTRQMDPIREDLLAGLSEIRPGPGRIPFFSTVTSDVLSGEKLNAEYWWRNVRQPVLFESAISRICDRSNHLFLEIGPHPSLELSLNECLSSRGISGRVFHSLRRETDESIEILSQLAKLHLADIPIDWAAVNQSAGNLVRLPNYSWHYQTHWLDEGEMASRLLPESHPFLSRRIAVPNPTWQCDLDPGRFPYLRDHQIWNSLVFPASGYGEIGLALAAELFPEDRYAVEDLESVRALFIPLNEMRRMQIAFDPADQSFTVSSENRGGNEWELNARGRLTRRSVPPLAKEPFDPGTIRNRLGGRIRHEQFYAEFEAIGYQFGPEFCLIETVYRSGEEALGEVRIPESVSNSRDHYQLHPTLLDACFQVSRGVQPLWDGAAPEDFLFLPESIRRIQLFKETLPDRLWAHAVRLEDREDAIRTDIRVYDEAGNPVAEILGFRAVRVGQQQAGNRVEDALYRFEWISETRAAEGAGHSSSIPTCLVLADQGEFAASLISKLNDEIEIAVPAFPGDSFRETSLNRFVVSPDSGADLVKLLRTLEERGDPPSLIIDCRHLASSGPEMMDPSQMWESRKRTSSAWKLCRALNKARPEKPPRVYFVTGTLSSSPLTGLARVANNEQSENRWTTVAVDPADPDLAADQLISEIIGNHDDLEVAYRHGKRLVHRLRPVCLEDLPRLKSRPAPTSSFRLETGKPGVLGELVWNETHRSGPGPDEVEVGVAAGGLNFRDVMKALGMYPGNPVDLLWFGDDFSGVVLRTGSNVTEFSPGDRVAGIAPYSFRSHALANRHLLFRLPEELSFAEAATLPTVFLTAHYALVELGRLQPGESVLIHAGAGGVGQAAIQVAQHLGLRIFATAGSPEKRAMLRDSGIFHVMDSRSLEFADEIMEITCGEGVDAVLNSLAGAFIGKSLSVLSPFGRFLEIGKIDVYGRSRIGLETLKNNISCHIIDLAQLLEKRPEKIASMFADLSAQFIDGVYRPLPHRIFPIARCAEAFRFMARAGHTGKVVLSFENTESLEIGPCSGEGHLFREDATYLITGGTSGFGWETAKWIAEQGARNLVLVSRSGPKKKEAAEIDRLRAEGIHIVEQRGDVTDTESMETIVGTIGKTLPPLKGIVHAAMVLHDDFISSLSAEDFHRVLKPKLLGAWNLHWASRELPLDHFICFSSFSAVIGGARQVNYNAGNAFLDSLAEYRRSQGLPSLTINWGALRGAGFVERNRKTAEYLEKTGMESFSANEALAILGELIQRDPGVVGAARVDWEKLGRFSPLVSGAPVYREIMEAWSQGKSGGSLVTRLAALPAGDREPVIAKFLAASVAGVLGIESEAVDRSTPITNLGLDSLMAVELINRVEGELGMNLPLGNLMRGPSVAELAQVVFEMFEVASTGETGDSDADDSGAPSTGIRSGDRSLDYWKGELEGASTEIGWPASRLSDRDGRSSIPFAIDADLTHAVVLFSAEHGLSPETSLLGAFAAFLHALTGRSDLLIGTYEDGAGNHPRLLRSQSNGNPSFADFLLRNQERINASKPFSLPSPEILTGALASGAPVWPWHRIAFHDDVAAPDTAVEDLNLAVRFADGTASGELSGIASRFDAERLGQIARQFHETIRCLLACPEIPLSETLQMEIDDGMAAPPAAPSALLRFEKQEGASRVDFEAESVLDPSIRPGPVSHDSKVEPSRIFLTGGTGFLGAFLLNELLEQTGAEEIHCLVRAPSNPEALERLRSNLARFGFEPTGFDRRVKPVTGDLTKPLFGLTESRFDELAKRIEVIYHNGAAVNLVLPYEALRPPNVNGTREILRLSCRGDFATPTHIVSTFTVQTTATNRGVLVTEDAPLPDCDSLLYGYSQSKWVAERMVGEARLRGLPVSIYRPGHITGDSRTGASNTGDLLHTMALTCLRLGAAPLRDAEFDVSPVDYVARAMVALSRQPALLGGTFHLTNPRPLQTRDFAGWMKDLNLGVETVPVQHWREKLLDLAEKTSSAELRPLADILAPQALSEDTAKSVHPRFDCQKTLAALEGTGIVCPPADTALLSTYLDFLLKSRDGKYLPAIESE